MIGRALSYALLCALSLSASAHAQELADPEDRESDSHRDDWYIGFSLGSGPASLTHGGESKSYNDFFDGREPPQGFDNNLRLSIGFEVGATINHQLLVGFKLAGMRQQAESSDADYELGLQHTQYLACATFFPMPDGRGLFVRGGAGAAAITVNQNIEVAGQSIDGADEQTGFGGMLGLGYAIWLGESFNLVIANDFHYAAIGGEESEGEPTSGWFNDISLGFMWY